MLRTSETLLLSVPFVCTAINDHCVLIRLRSLNLNLSLSLSLNPEPVRQPYDGTPIGRDRSGDPQFNNPDSTSKNPVLGLDNPGHHTR